MIRANVNVALFVPSDCSCALEQTAYPGFMNHSNTVIPARIYEPCKMAQCLIAKFWTNTWKHMNINHGRQGMHFLFIP